MLIIISKQKNKNFVDINELVTNNSKEINIVIRNLAAGGYTPDVVIQNAGYNLLK